MHQSEYADIYELYTCTQWHKDQYYYTVVLNYMYMGLKAGKQCPRQCSETSLDT